MKNHSRNLHAPLCGIFCPNSVAVARYGTLIRTKSPTNCDAHLAESLLGARSNTTQTSSARCDMFLSFETYSLAGLFLFRHFFVCFFERR
ncbi:hypothetical protein DWZ38_18695 [Ruminococcus sp. AF31-8BH]|nr:hypothetical protein DWZ38_18695 [Ruminococcus sp. AF31-8BH]